MEEVFQFKLNREMYGSIIPESSFLCVFKAVKLRKHYRVSWAKPDDNGEYRIGTRQYTGEEVDEYLSDSSWIKI